MNIPTLISALEEIHDRLIPVYENSIISDIPEIQQDLKSIIKELDGHEPNPPQK